MEPIAFVDTEIDPNSRKILDIGSVKINGNTFHGTSVAEFIAFIKGTPFICGHNILKHDIKYIGAALQDAGIRISYIIDTLYLSPLLFPAKPYHALLKDDKLQPEDFNNPLNDAIKAKDLFLDEVSKFEKVDQSLQQIFYSLLHDKKEFQAFFKVINYRGEVGNVEILIRQRFKDDICLDTDLAQIIVTHPVALAYCLSLINANERYSITPPWVLHHYHEVERIMYRLRNKPCLRGCNYCNSAFDIHKGLKWYFDLDQYREFGGEPLQEMAVKAAIDNKSILVVFPTGGGKSITFQVPALMSGQNVKGLTVVISPLQSLMKDQVDNLEKNGIPYVATINGLLDSVERSKSFERVEDGSASLLYISPESLRSKTIERLLLGRKIVRFVIDEAHCFSAWGQDFRVDYLYIGDFIKSLQEKKNLEDPIPVSCFTATAKQKVIEDIRDYFRDKLSLELELFTSKVSRTNLQYQVIERQGEEEKYQTVRDLIEQKPCPTIVYVSRTKKANILAQRLKEDGFSARAYHGKMDVKEKTVNQEGFQAGDISIMVATSAFGMGVDKKDVGMVIHYDISDSLENYIQEAGRAGRDLSIIADCFVLYNEDDLGKHFTLLNQTKLSIKEINQIWTAIKLVTKFRTTVSLSALEIARKAGWDDNVREIETRVTTAIAALEDAGYLKRLHNNPQIFANSILAKNAQEAVDKINESTRFTDREKEQAVRIIKKLFSSKRRKEASDEEAESRIDYISDHLGISKKDVINIVGLLKAEKILANTKDLTAFIKRGESKRSLGIVKMYTAIESYLMTCIDEEMKVLHIKELNEAAEKFGCNEVTPNKIKTIFNYWAIKNWIKRKPAKHSKNHCAIAGLFTREELTVKMEKRHQLAVFIVEYLYEKSKENTAEANNNAEEILVEFSVYDLKVAFETQSLFNSEVSLYDVEDVLFFLSRIEAIKIEGGFLVTYNRLMVERVEQNNKVKYKVEDFQKLSQYYESKIQQIHIVGEYAKMMINDYKQALQFVDDYFKLNYTTFLNKYFKGSRQHDIKRNITPAKFKQLFGDLSPAQLKIINDKEAQYMVVAAGPGSGKTRLLVHKLASLFYMEDVKHEQLLMLTFSRAAATEFKKRLLGLIGNAAHFIEIKTFHSYCFDLLGKVGNLEKSAEILATTIQKITDGEVEQNRITKTVLVIDEAQDMDKHEFDLVQALIKQNEDMRVIAVGDDDQNIYAFRGADAKYMEQLTKFENAVMYDLVENYRSKRNLVEFSNHFAKRIPHRLKKFPIVSIQPDNGQIKLIRYQNSHLIVPLVNDILTTELVGTTCVLTKTNEEALQIAGLLVNKGLPAKVVQTNDGFELDNLLEIRVFLSGLELDDNTSIISDELWEHSKRTLVTRFQRSTKLDACKNLIRDFEAINPGRKYKSDLMMFIRESRLEDFIKENGETILVSTIHKAKGKEFDNVFLLLEGLNLDTDDVRRQVYVALTRAKKQIVVHLNGGYFDDINVADLLRSEDRGGYPVPKELSVYLKYTEVWLGYFVDKQDVITQMTSGDELVVNGYECLNLNGQSVLKPSNSFVQRIERELQHYVLIRAKVNVILYWKGEGMEKEILIVLPEFCFKRRDVF